MLQDCGQLCVRELSDYCQYLYQLVLTVVLHTAAETGAVLAELHQIRLHCGHLAQLCPAQGTRHIMYTNIGAAGGGHYCHLPPAL